VRQGLQALASRDVRLRGNRTLRAAAVLALALAASNASAHGGGLDKHGCHHNRKTGQYHCHRASPASAAKRNSPEKAKRSSSAKAEFRRTHACPSTGRTTGQCPGYEVDHVVPLACGGTDDASNMQWLTTEANRSKGDLGCGR
jgi:hypothetical protein